VSVNRSPASKDRFVAVNASGDPVAVVYEVVLIVEILCVYPAGVLGSSISAYQYIRYASVELNSTYHKQ
jgi:hypothetical protein